MARISHAGSIEAMNKDVLLISVSGDGAWKVVLSGKGYDLPDIILGGDEEPNNYNGGSAEKEAKMHGPLDHKLEGWTRCEAIVEEKISRDGIEQCPYCGDDKIRVAREGRAERITCFAELSSYEGELPDSDRDNANVEQPHKEEDHRVKHLANLTDILRAKGHSNGFEPLPS